MPITTKRTHRNVQAIGLFLLISFGISIKSSYAQECLASCLYTSDYQHSDSFLHFSRNHFPTENHLASPQEPSTDTSWRHRFDIVITQNDTQVSVFDEQGEQHIFTANQNGTFSPLSEKSGELIMEDGNFQWTNDDAVHHKFQGSFLTEITSAQNKTLRLQYTQKKLSEITNEQGESIHLNYSDNSLDSLTTPQGATIDLSYQTCLPHPPSHVCDTEQHPLPDFHLDQPALDVIKVDARPASCESYFIEYFGTARGSEIELGLAAHHPYQGMLATVRSFPIVDFVTDSEWIAVRSRDLASPSFNDTNNPNALFYRLMRDGQEIQSRLLTPLEENGVLTVEEEGVTTSLEWENRPQELTLHVIVRHQIASQSHWQQIARARELLSQRYDIRLEVVIIP